MKMQANQIRPGWVIEYNGKQCLVIGIDLVIPGKGNATIQVEMRDVARASKPSSAGAPPTPSKS